MNNNIKKKIIVLVIFLDLLLSSCDLNNNNDKKYSDDQDFDKIENHVISNALSNDSKKETDADSNLKKDVNSEYTVESIYKPRELLNEELELINQKVFINANDFYDFKNFIKSIYVAYDYEELYKDTPNISMNYCHTIKETKIIDNNCINTNLLFKYIKNNSEEIIKDIKNYTMPSDTEIKELCDIIAISCNNAIKTGNVDKYCLEEKLQNLKYVLFNDYAYGFYKQEMDLIALNKLTGDNDIIKHEVEHLIQSASSKELSDMPYEYRNGYCYFIERNQINPYNWVWFVEACAESISKQYQDNKEMTLYSQECRALNSLKLITFNNTYDLENTLYTNNIDNLYNYFNAKTDEDKAEIRKLFYAFTILISNNPGNEGSFFYRSIKNIYDINLYEDDKLFLNNISGSISLTESKIFYNNLINHISNRYVSINDIFECISIFEIELSRQLWYQSKAPYLENFLTSYSNIQDTFFSVLAAKIDINLDEIKKLYYLYNNTNKNVDKIEFLSDEENILFKNIYEDIQKDKRDAILKVYTDVYKNNELNPNLKLTLN